jgi:beta-lactamase regulating signal transducer with metallopeptidase domain
MSAAEIPALFEAAWLGDLAFQSSLLLLVAALVNKVCAHTAARMLVAWSACLGLALLACASLAPVWPRVALWPQLAEQNAAPIVTLIENSFTADVDATAAPAAPATEPALVEALESPRSLDLAAAPPALSLRASALNWLLRVWLAFAAAASAWVLLGAWQVRRMVRAASEAPPAVRQQLKQIVGARRPPGLKMTRRLSSAAVMGIWRPCILLPQSSESEASAPGLTAALRHEWAHVEHGDLWLLALVRLLLPLFGWHPLFWLLRRQIREDQELLADAAAAGEHPVEYAQALLAWAQRQDQPRPPLGLAALAMWEKPNQLSRRIEMVLHESNANRSQLSRLARLALGASLLGAGLTLSVCSFRGQVSQAQEPPTTDDAAAPRAAQNSFFELKSKFEKANLSRAPQSQVQIVFDNLLGEVKPARSKAGDPSFVDIFQQAVGNNCRQEGNVLVAMVSTQDGEELVVELQKHGLLEILSRPKVLTVVGQEAHIEIGQQAPVAVIDETVNGERKKRIEGKTIGTQLHLLPRLSSANAQLTLQLDVRLESSKLKPNKEEGAVLGIRSRLMKLSLDIQPGQVLVLAERPVREAEAEEAAGLLLAVVRPAIVAADPAAAEAAGRKGALDAAVTQATRHNSQESWERKLREAHASMDRLQAQISAARQALRQIEGVDPKVLESDDDQALADALERHGRKELAEEIRRDLERVKVHELGLFTEESRRSYQNLARQNEELRQQMELLRQELQQMRASRNGTPVTALPPAAPRPKAEARSAGDAAAAAELRLLELDLQEAEANHRLASAEFEQTNTLFKKGVVSDGELRTYKVKLELSSIAVERARLKLEAAKARLQAAPKGASNPEPVSR